MSQKLTSYTVLQNDLDEDASQGLEEPVLATVGADDTAERISALLQESQLECELEEYSDCTKEKMDLLKKRLNRRLIDLVDIANLCRAERIRMLS
eukprot:gene23712-28739_t